MGKVKSGRYISLTVGERRNSLTFLNEVGKDRNGLYMVNCQCICGSKVTIRKSEFRATGTKSCGCAQKEAAGAVGKSKRHGFGESNRKTVYMRYRRDAKQRGLEFELTLEDFADITAKSCYYCGSPPGNMESAPKHYGEFVYSGIDRRDNAVGYVAGNTVPCCIQCNKAKGTLTAVDFKAWLSKAYTHLFT